MINLFFNLFQAFVQVLAEEQEYQDYRYRYTRIRQVKHRSKEDALPCRIRNQREVKHIHHFAVKPACITEQFSVENTIDNITHRSGRN